jgi:hypothetical protein
MRFNTLSASVALALVFAAFAASVASPSPDTAKMRANFEQVANFRLTDTFLHKNLAYSLDVAKHPCQNSIKAGLSLLRDLQSKPLDQVIARFDTQPGVQARLAKHGLSAHDAVVGGLVMLMVGLDQMASESGGTVSSGKGVNTPAMKANKAFYKAHLPEIRAAHKKRAAIVHQQMRAKGREAACIRKNMHGFLSSGSP